MRKVLQRCHLRNGAMPLDVFGVKRRRQLHIAADTVREFGAKQCDIVTNDVHRQDGAIVSQFGNYQVLLPTSTFGSMLCMKAKYRLQRVNREWREFARMPALWLELNLRDSYGEYGDLSDPRFAQVESLTLPLDKATSAYDILRIRRALPRLAAIDYTCLSWTESCASDFSYAGYEVDVLTEAFASLPGGGVGAPLLHLRMGCGALRADQLRWALEKHAKLRVIEFGANRFIEELTYRTFVDDYFSTHCALEALSLECTRGIERHAPFHAEACAALVRYLLVKLPNLKLLCLNQWTGISEANVSAVLRACPKLEELRLVGVTAGDGHGVVTRPEGVSSWRVAHLPGEESERPILIKDHPGDWYAGLGVDYDSSSDESDTSFSFSYGSGSESEA